MLWLAAALFAYLLFAVNAVGDKYLLAKVVPSPLQFTFYVGALGGLVVLLAPFFGFPLPGAQFLFTSAFSGIIFIIALGVFYKNLNVHESSRIIPAIGGLLPLLTLLLAYAVFPREPIGSAQALSLILFVAASVVVTAQRGKRILLSLGAAFFPALLFAMYFVSLKYVYSLGPFWDGLLWARLFGALAALAIFAFSPSVRSELFRKKERVPEAPAETKRGGTGTFLGIQGAGATAGVLQNAAVYLAPAGAVAVVNALQGVQFLFVQLFAFALSARFPSVLKESFTGIAAIQKIAASALFLAGIVVLLAAN